MKKKIALLLASIMLVGAIPSFASAGKISPRIPLTGKGFEVTYFNEPDTGSTDVQLVGEVAQRFTADGKLIKVSMHCPSYANSIGSLTFKLYQWNESYSKTLKGDVLASETYTDFKDNAKLTLSIPGFATGDLLFVVCDPEERVGVWTSIASKPHSPNELLYIGGVAQEGRAMNITAEVSPTASFPEIDSSETVSAYEKIDLSKPADSSNMSFLTHNNEPYATLSTGNSGYVAFPVDFGSESPKGAILRTRNVVSDTAKVQVIADNPDNGPVLCEFYAELTKEFTYFMEIPAKITEQITGKHNVYVAVMYSGLELYDLTFVKETPGPSWDEQRLDDFLATKDFELTDTYSDTWSGTDLLGRKLADNQTAGDFNPDKQVGLFYWTWHASRSQNIDASINQRVVDFYDGPESDIKNDMNYSGWRDTGIWNESIYGFYSGLDEWVIRKQLEMFSAAGVDGLFFDATNGTKVFTGGYMQLAKTIHQMHTEGTPTPGIAFMLPFMDMSYNVTDLEMIYESMYSVGLYSDAWYYWDGKPVVMGYPDNLIKDAQNEEIRAEHREILDFFTFRPAQPSYREGPTRANHWPWLEVYPQHPYGESEKYGCETVSVGIAQNSSDLGLVAMNGKDVYGRSFTYKDRYSKLSDTSKYYGYNFQEQWNRAFELNPEFVFVTGWNEWTAGHYDSWGADGATGAYPDQYSDEYSRDAEPTKGVFKDNYYMQLANNIRKFKGVRPTPTASAEKTISLDGGFDQWADVGPEFIGYKGGTEPRNSNLRQNGTNVSNTTGRNDIIRAKVAKDSENMYFYVETADSLTPHTDKNWMRLFINTDRKYKTGWEGYDFVLNRTSPTQNTATLEKWNGKHTTDWSFEEAGQVEYTYSGNKMMVKIPKAMLGLNGNAVDIEFKWNDNMQVQGDIMDFYVNGDTAPIGRFAYRYVDQALVQNKAEDEPVDPATTLAHITRRFIAMGIGNSYAYAYGQKTPIDTLSDTTAPVIVNGKTMVPVRFLAESIGATVEWDEATQQIKILGEKRVYLTMGSNTMRVEKEKRTLQSPAMEIENRTYVPLRDIVEALDIKCTWIEPGLILCGPTDGIAEILVNGGIDMLLSEYGMSAE